MEEGERMNQNETRLNLSGSWQQGHFTTYKTLSHIYVVYKGFYPPLSGNYTTRQPTQLVGCGGLAKEICL